MMRSRFRERGRSATQFDDYGSRCSELKCMTQQKLGPTPRYEHAGFDSYTQPGKLRPSHDLLQWRTAHPLSDHVFELAWRVGCA